jgi:ubiquinone/menaquinone biosynthesis C-methylase UbiE
MLCPQIPANACSTHETGADISALRNRQQATWESGDYAVIGTTLQIVGESLAESADICAGESVIDVAAGNGNVGLAAARRFARVTATDYVQHLLDKAAARAHAEGVDLACLLADAEALPFADESFDAALSCFGVMFSADHHRTAQELVRVTRRAGRIGLANWTPEGFIGEVFRTIASHVAPPAGSSSPLRWGTESGIVELFGPDAAEIRCARRHFRFRYRSAAHWLAVFREFYGPALQAFAALDADGREWLAADLTALAGRANTAGTTSLVVPAEYLEIVIVRK